MAKGKYEYWLSGEGLLRLGAWARDGAKKEDIAKAMGISRSTLNEWEKKFSAIEGALKNGREIADIRIENALYEKALGIKETVIKPMKLRHVEYDETTGKKKKEWEEVKMVPEQVYVPPDTKAQIYWLGNRKPETWKDRREPDPGDTGSAIYLEEFLRATKPTAEDMAQLFEGEDGEPDEATSS